MSKPEQDRVGYMLEEMVTLLCKNSLQFNTVMIVQGVIGITLDDDILVVHINEKYGPGGVVLESSNSSTEVAIHTKNQEMQRINDKLEDIEVLYYDIVKLKLPHRWAQSSNLCQINNGVIHI